VTPDQPLISELNRSMEDGYEGTITSPFGPVGTFTGFKVSEIPERRIDYIFVSKNDLIIKKYAALAHLQDLRYPSDHFPVMVELSFKKK